MADDAAHAIVNQLPGIAGGVFTSAIAALGLWLAARLKAKPDSITAEAAKITAEAAFQKALQEGFTQLQQSMAAQLKHAQDRLKEAQDRLDDATDRMETAELVAAQAQAETMALRGELRMAKQEADSLRRRLRDKGIDVGPDTRKFDQSEIGAEVV